MSRWSTTTNSDQAMSLPNRIAVTRPRGAGLRTVMPHRKSSRGRSSTYRSRPVSLASASRRRTNDSVVMVGRLSRGILGATAGKGNRSGVAAARFLSQFAAGFALPPCEASAMRSTSALLSLAVVGLSACAAAARVGAPAPAPAPALPAALDSTAIRPGRFDAGKMWTFDTPPLDYFQEAHGFRPDSTWLARARLGALRFADYCSASFVSPRGLVLTNHHCSRENTGKVMRPGENFDSTGFYAATEAEERRVPGLFVEQLLAIADVSGAVDSASRAGVADEAAVAALEERLTRAAHDSTIRVQVVRL